MKQFLSIVIFALVVLPSFSNAATIQFGPQAATFKQGQEFQVQIILDTQGVYANTVGAYFSYPQDKIEFVSIGNLNSNFLVIEKQGGAGVVRISAGMPTPGFVGAHTIAAVTFRALASGQAQLQFSADAAVLSDKDNKNVLSASPKATYQIQAVVSAPQPQAVPPLSPTSPVITAPLSDPETPPASLPQTENKKIRVDVEALTSPFMYAVYALGVLVLAAIVLVMLRIRKQKMQEKVQQEIQNISVK